MKMPFLQVLSFSLYGFPMRSQSRRIGEKAQDAYWERENAANNTRRKSLDNLRYIVIPFDSLPMETLKEDEK